MSIGHFTLAHQPLALLLLAFTISADAAAQTLPPKDRFDLFLLVGQSNMAGRGDVADQDRQRHDRVLTLDADGQWVAAQDPIHFDKPAVVGVGLGRTFGIELAQDDPQRTIGLIPCAVGGSPIDAWQPGAFYEPTGSHPWDDAIRRARRAMQDGRLRGILWHQGESDSKPELAQRYEGKLQRLIKRFRDELDAADCPFIVGQLGQFAERPWNDAKRMVDLAHRRLPSQVSATAFVSSAGLGHRGDEVHFDAHAYRQLGRRYGRAYRMLAPPPSDRVRRVDFEVERSVAREGFDGKMCWVHARAGLIPAGTAGDAADDSDAALSSPLAVMTTQPLLLSGSDVFYELHTMTSEDGAASWSEPSAEPGFQRRQVDDAVEMTVCDFTPAWHRASGRLLGIGHTVWYENNRVMRVRPRATAYAVFDPAQRRWSPWQELEMPDEPRFENAGAGSVQRVDREDGEILLPIYFKQPPQPRYSVTVLSCQFDGQRMSYETHGNEISVDIGRGLYEPSLAQFDGRYFLTLRNDEAGYVSSGDDGLHFRPVRQWTFDDGQPLGNANTQQHWVTHRDALYLVYTRRAADNDHVFRHRAPLWVAQVDPQRLVVLRDTERIIVPEHGARLGNFGVTRVADDEVWVTVAEWMQPRGVEAHGSDGRIWVTKIRWPE